ncbi:hypothetical protein [Methylocaldum sp. RMAD-M]|jgi:hypothetical protein|uniref:hypothetical protein n=1 Tax=Methylocaldum sp. RMAD-M TaxID=2806557 RepID=UPI000A31FF80|nr:hypothetical protein [Methylocaldum sp. RMAD-M]MBP1152704.1 hypothetical protein [Methylocaldum sp. RMAD-M]
MGGIGSGRRWQSGKNTTSDYRALDVRRLQRDRLLRSGETFAWQWTRNGQEVASIQIRVETNRLILIYRHRKNDGDWQPMEYPVYLEWTPCNYGGGRAWFLCPAAGCGRHVALLYIGRAGIFACRHCYRLAYASQREPDDDRAARRADAIRRRLRWQPGILNGKGSKPKGMHWRTFSRLEARHDAFVHASLMGMATRLQLMDRGLADLRDDLTDDG